jgi:uncharacterized membrane protein
MLAAMLVFRLFHVISGVLWVGGVVLLSFFVAPAVRAAGPAGGQFMRQLLIRTPLAAYIPSVAGLTVLSGFGMFWVDSTMAAGNWAATGPGITYSIGGLAGLLALIIGGIMMGRSISELKKIAMASDPGAPPAPEQAARIAQLQQRVDKGTKIVLPLLVIAVVAMAVARYV